MMKIMLTILLATLTGSALANSFESTAERLARNVKMRNHEWEMEKRQMHKRQRRRLPGVAPKKERRFGPEAEELLASHLEEMKRKEEKQEEKLKEKMLQVATKLQEAMSGEVQATQREIDRSLVQGILYTLNRFKETYNDTKFWHDNCFKKAIDMMDKHIKILGKFKKDCWQTFTKQNTQIVEVGVQAEVVKTIEYRKTVNKAVRFHKTRGEHAGIRKVMKDYTDNNNVEFTKDQLVAFEKYNDDGVHVYKSTLEPIEGGSRFVRDPEEQSYTIPLDSWNNKEFFEPHLIVKDRIFTVEREVYNNVDLCYLAENGTAGLVSPDDLLPEGKVYTLTKVNDDNTAVVQEQDESVPLSTLKPHLYDKNNKVIRDLPGSWFEVANRPDLKKGEIVTVTEIVAGEARTYSGSDWKKEMEKEKENKGIRIDVRDSHGNVYPYLRGSDLIFPDTKVKELKTGLNREQQDEQKRVLRVLAFYSKSATTHEQELGGRNDWNILKVNALKQHLTDAKESMEEAWERHNKKLISYLVIFSKLEKYVDDDEYETKAHKFFKAVKNVTGTLYNIGIAAISGGATLAVTCGDKDTMAKMLGAACSIVSALDVVIQKCMEERHTMYKSLNRMYKTIKKGSSDDGDYLNYRTCMKVNWYETEGKIKDTLTFKWIEKIAETYAALGYRELSDCERARMFEIRFRLENILAERTLPPQGVECKGLVAYFKDEMGLTNKFKRVKKRRIFETYLNRFVFVATIKPPSGQTVKYKRYGNLTVDEKHNLAIRRMKELLGAKNSPDVSFMSFNYNTKKMKDGKTPLVGCIEFKDCIPLKDAERYLIELKETHDFKIYHLGYGNGEASSAFTVGGKAIVTTFSKTVGNVTVRKDEEVTVVRENSNNTITTKTKKGEEIILDKSEVVSKGDRDFEYVPTHQWMEIPVIKKHIDESKKVIVNIHDPTKSHTTWATGIFKRAAYESIQEKPKEETETAEEVRLLQVVDLPGLFQSNPDFFKYTDEIPFSQAPEKYYQMGYPSPMRVSVLTQPFPLYESWQEAVKLAEERKVAVTSVLKRKIRTMGDRLCMLGQESTGMRRSRVLEVLRQAVTILYNTGLQKTNSKPTVPKQKTIKPAAPQQQKIIKPAAPQHQAALASISPMEQEADPTSNIPDHDD